MIKVVMTDITELSVDAIVNAANNHLWMGSGVAGAIKRKGGAAIEEEAMSKGPIPVGEAVVTSAGLLKSDYVIHAAAMGQDLSTSAEKVRAATRHALLRAEELKLSSIAFPALGTGVGGLKPDEVSMVMMCEARRHLARGSALEEVIFALFGDDVFIAFSNMAERNKIVCLGDSITYGYPYGPETSWVETCSGVLGLEMLNRGINGDTTSQMRRRFNAHVISVKPAYVIIMGGTNDAWVGFTSERIQENIEGMAAKAFEHGICPVIGLPVPVNLDELNGFMPGDTIYVLDCLREWIRDFADENFLPVLDFYMPLLDPETGNANPAYFLDDSHPNQNGYRVLAEAAEKPLLNLKKGLSTFISYS